AELSTHNTGTEPYVQPGTGRTAWRTWSPGWTSRSGLGSGRTGRTTSTGRPKGRTTARGGSLASTSAAPVRPRGRGPVRRQRRPRRRHELPGAPSFGAPGIAICRADRGGLRRRRDVVEAEDHALRRGTRGAEADRHDRYAAVAVLDEGDAIRLDQPL